MKKHLLVVDDDDDMAAFLREAFEDRGYDVATAHGSAEALAVAREQRLDVAVTDLRMERFDGLDLLDEFLRVDPTLPVILMTAFGDIGSAVAAVKRGAFHYLAKPFKLDELTLYVDRAFEQRRLKDENTYLRVTADASAGVGQILGMAASTRRLVEIVRRAARSSAPVLVQGESGVGKELVARALHHEGPRAARRFVAVNCTALPEQLFESELFGHARGAFTGAAQARRGLFVEADGGTLFLDEIGDMPPALQAKLLRVLEDGQVRPLGTDVPRAVDVRVVAATHQDLDARVKSGLFRADLLFRLRVLAVDVPPLRDRAEDIPLLVRHFLAAARRRNSATTVERLAPAALERLCRARWPGNIRELESVLERLVVLGHGPEVAADDLPPLGDDLPAPLLAAREAMPRLRVLEDEYIAWVIERCGGNKTRAAEILGIDASTIYRRGRGPG
ncbi:MAG: sigma-54-dependent Fis family transcriptional regulator [Deltaproteobacteria bacterium]|nr:sigma-54-dependent Fis family transcriptional regulator [Deltaproteobacteria bacterium]